MMERVTHELKSSACNAFRATHLMLYAVHEARILFLCGITWTQDTQYFDVRVPPDPGDNDDATVALGL